MNIRILTHAYGLNYGAFLQALGTQYFLTTAFNKLENPSISYGPSICSSKLYLELRSRFLSPSSLSPFVNIGILNSFLKFHKQYLPSHLNAKPDFSIYGADEILNISSTFFTPAFIPSYENLSESYYFSASAGNTPISSFPASYIQVFSDMCDFNAFTCRDTYTHDILKSLTGSDIPITCDPAYHLPLNQLSALHYNSLPASTSSDYLLIYGHHLPRPYLDQIAQFATANRLNVISYPYKNKINSLPIKSLSPFELLSLFSKSKFVITNMFHGVVLSSILQPRFCFIPNDLRVQKLSYLSSSYQIVNKFWHDPHDQLAIKLDAYFDSTAIEDHTLFSANLHFDFLKSKFNS